MLAATILGALSQGLDYAKIYWIHLTLGFFALRIFYLRFLHRCAKFPGPFLGSITDFYAVYYFLREDQHLFEEKLHQKYGPVVRVRPNMLLISDATYLPTIYHKSVDKTPFHTSGGLGFGEAAIAAIPHKEHARLKKRIASSYSMTSIRASEKYIDERVNEWLDKVRTLFCHPQPQTFDFACWSQYFAYDVLSDIVFGAPFGFVRTASDVANLIKGLHVGLPLGGVLSRIPVINNIFLLPGLKSALLPKPGDKEGIGAVMGFRDGLIQQRIEKGNHKQRTDFLQALLSAKNEDGTPIPMIDLKSELLIAMLAGSDTTASTLRHLLIYIAENPGVYAKLQAEVDAAFDEGRIKNAVPNYDECLSLPYFNATLREALRLSNPVPAYLPRMVSSPGWTIAGLYVYPGTEVAMNAYVVHRDTATFGADAREFRPERWLGSAEQRAVLEKYDFAFGYGSRTCLGKNLAMVEMSKIGISILRRFKFKLAPKPANATYDREHRNLGVWVERGIWVQFEERNVPEWSSSPVPESKEAA